MPLPAGVFLPVQQVPGLVRVLRCQHHVVPGLGDCVPSWKTERRKRRRRRRKKMRRKRRKEGRRRNNEARYGSERRAEELKCVEQHRGGTFKRGISAYQDHVGP
jgi:hypothetical protein